MNVLIIGAGSGSFAIRGRQLGAALGARVTSTPSEADVTWADVIVLVKRAIHWFRDQAVRSGKAVVWDALDFWVQPSQNRLSPVDAGLLARRTAGEGVAIIGATKAMATALAGRYLSHHAWPGLSPVHARPHVRTVAYQGGAVYLGKWAAWLAEACAARGWQFVVNPPDLRVADILVAFRDGEWDGWICREWKSGVKFVNAIAVGRPILRQDSAASREVDPAGSVVESREQLEAALDAWADLSVRDAVVLRSRKRACDVTVDSVAQTYRQLLEAHACPA